MAIRLSDLDGPGGFNGKILLRNNLKEIEIPIESFKYKHHAFLLDGRLIVHNLENQELLDKSDFFKENIVRGFATGTPNEYSILFDRILSKSLKLRSNTSQIDFRSKISKIKNSNLH